MRPSRHDNRKYAAVTGTLACRRGRGRIAVTPERIQWLAAAI